MERHGPSGVSRHPKNAYIPRFDRKHFPYTHSELIVEPAQEFAHGKKAVVPNPRSQSAAKKIEKSPVGKDSTFNPPSSPKTLNFSQLPKAPPTDPPRNNRKDQGKKYNKKRPLSPADYFHHGLQEAMAKAKEEEEKRIEDERYIYGRR